MAAALIGGLTKRGLPSERVVVADPSHEQLQRLVRAYGVKTAPDNVSAVRGAEVVILAVKPQQMRAVALGLAPHLAEAHPLLISVAAGIPHAALARWFGPRIPVIRTMPNRPALNGFGATGLFAPPSVGAANRALAEMIMAAVSATVWVEHESQMDTVTALSGSGPAYFFLFMEALEAAAHERGLPNDVAHQLTLETAFGAAQMARESRESLATLREQVTSKGGTTAAALAVLDAAGLRAIVAHAVAAADRRSAELAAEFGAPDPLESPQSAMDAIRYIVDTLLWLLTLAFVLRLLFQLVRANFRDPMADAIVRVTNWLILPLRRLLPPIGKLDTATVVAVIAVASVRTFAALALAGQGIGDPLQFLRITIVNLADLVLRIYLFALLLYWLTSFVSPGGYAPRASACSRNSANRS